MIRMLEELVSHKNLIILGFGREGQSAYRLLRQYFPNLPITIADRDTGLEDPLITGKADKNLKFKTGDKYLEGLSGFGLVIRSPGILIPDPDSWKGSNIHITSQADLMLKAYHGQVTGITGTKGKSTTSSLIHHIHTKANKDAILVGNIGIPPFDSIALLKSGTRIVFELSSSQLEDISVAPHISILLNLYPEHLDRYATVGEYYQAKFNILLRQEEGDFFIYNEDLPVIRDYINHAAVQRKFLTFSCLSETRNGCHLDGNIIYFTDDAGKRPFLQVTGDIPLPGKHNLMNIMAAILACKCAGIADQDIINGIMSFRGLPHRLEYAGTFRDILFYNDSIATIPEATMEAVKTLKNVDTLILGGHDRRLDYRQLVIMLGKSKIRNFIFMGKAGMRMLGEFRKHMVTGKNLLPAGSLEEAFGYITRYTMPGMICLLSPAAASYDSFRNFEERGNLFKKLARSL
jgi:UDP-N-acetylmuramoylalanine--D-glutamate ligase